MISKLITVGMELIKCDKVIRTAPNISGDLLF